MPQLKTFKIVLAVLNVNIPITIQKIHLITPL